VADVRTTITEVVTALGTLGADDVEEALEKRPVELHNVDDDVWDSIGSNFNDAVGAAKLPVTNTPLITSSGASRTDASYKLPAELAPALKTGFDIAPNDPPEVVTLPGDAGYAIVSPGQVVPAAPAPLATIRAQVTTDWINSEATKRAEAAAGQITAKANGNVSLADAIKLVGAPIPPSRSVAARRIQIADPQGNVPPALKILFTAGAGKARMAPNPGGGGFFVVKVNKITPGNALSSPGLIGQVQGELSQAAAQDYAQQFVADMKRELKIKRNESAIQGFRARMLSSGN